MAKKNSKLIIDEDAEILKKIKALEAKHVRLDGKALTDK